MNSRIKYAIVGAAVMLLAELLVFYAVAAMGLLPVNADGTVPKLEKTIARKALHAAIDRQAPKGPNPLALNDANLIAGIKLYVADCAVCHGAADGNDSHIAVGLYQHAPQLAKNNVYKDEFGEIYWKIKHGIRLTGMPSFSKTLSEDDILKLALFLQNIRALPPAAQKAWDAVPSAAR